MLPVPSKIATKFSRFTTISFVRLLRSLKSSEVVISASNHYHASPFFGLSIPTGALEAATRICVELRISYIFGARGQPEITNPIVGKNSVFMVDIGGRPFSVLNEPSQTMRAIFRAINSDGDIAVSADAAGDLAGPTTSSTNLPVQDSSFWIVAQQLFDALFRRQHFMRSQRIA